MTTATESRVIVVSTGEQGPPGPAGPAQPSWSAATKPWLLAHRGATTAGAPENTYAAFDLVAANGLAGLETDVRKTADGTLILMHDATPDRTCGTAGSKTIASLLADQVMRCDASQIYNPTLFSPQWVPSLDGFLSRYGGHHLLLIEVKDRLDATATALATKIKALGLQSSTAIYTFEGSESNLLAVEAVDSTIKRILYGISPTQAELAAAHANAVMVADSVLTSVYVELMQGYGYEVFTCRGGFEYQYYDRVERVESAIAAGVDAVLIDDPIVSGFVGAYTPAGGITVPVPYNLLGGWRPYGAAGTWALTVASSYVTWTGYGSPISGDFNVFFPPGVRPLASRGTTQTYTLTLKATAVLGTDTTKWLGLLICCDKDAISYFDSNGVVYPTNGFLFLYRQNGAARLQKISSAGVVSTLANATWDAYTTAAEISLTVSVTAAGITVTRTDTTPDLTIAAADTTVTRTGFLGICGLGVAPGVGQVALVY